MAKVMNPTKVITGPETRWSYANVWEAKSINGGAPKFSVSLIIKKDDPTIEKIKAAIQAAYEEGQAKLKGNGKSVPPLSRTRSATAIWNARTIPPMPARTSSTPTTRPRPALWMLTASPSWSTARCIPASMAARPSASMPSTARATVGSPAL